MYNTDPATFLVSLAQQIKLLTGIEIDIQDGPGTYWWVSDPKICAQAVPSDTKGCVLTGKSGHAHIFL
jgi:hypothetical protein